MIDRSLNPGEIVALRGIFNRRPFYIQSAIVVRDTPAETALLVIPGAECAAPEGYLHKKHGDHSTWDRWQEALTDSWKLEIYTWTRNRFLILLEPQKYYATVYIWQHTSGDFQCYYINFQLPFVRSHCGFDTLDLDLDMVIDASHAWEWKDMEDYREGIKSGGIRPEWASGVETAQQEVLSLIDKRQYPLDGSWLDWKPEPHWEPPGLPASWDRV